MELKAQDSRALAQYICFLEPSLEPSPRAVPSRELGIEETLCRGLGLQGGLKDTAELGWAT